MIGPKEDAGFSFSASFGKTLEEFNETSAAVREELSRIEEQWAVHQPENDDLLIPS